jgi:hypothetical protein
MVMQHKLEEEKNQPKSTILLIKTLLRVRMENEEISISRC